MSTLVSLDFVAHLTPFHKESCWMFYNGTCPHRCTYRVLFVQLFL